MPACLLRPALLAPLACASLLALAGCGGDSDPPASGPSETAGPGGGGSLAGGEITARNAPVLARDTLDLAISLHDLAEQNYGVLTGAAVDAARRIPDVLTFAYRHLRQFASAPLPGGEALGGVVLTSTFPCTGGGRYTVAFDDADSNNRLSTGDGATFTFESCATDGVVANGGIGYSRLKIDGPAATPTGLDADFSYTRFRVLDAGTETTVDGSARHGVVVTTAAPEPLAIDARTLVSSMTYASSDGWRYTLTEVQSRAQTDYGRSTYSFAMTGKISSPAFGTVTVDTPTPIAGSLGQSPKTGILTVHASDGSGVRLTSLGETGARIETDANADGTHESSATFTWKALNAL